MKKLSILFTVLLLGFLFTACDDDDTNNKNNNNQTEICDNQVDDDGDGLIDCDDTEDCSDATVCQNVQEDCTNGIDDDGDGLVDCDDDDCTDDASCQQDIVKYLTVISTADIHSHLMGVGPARDFTPLDNTDDDGTTSGLSRIAAVINKIKAGKAANNIPTVLVDSGDGLMGDMVDLLSGSTPPIFHFFQLMQYDSVMLGNHDYDWTPEGTAAIINAATTNVGFNRPLLATNIITDATSTDDDGIEALLANNTIVRYVIKPIDDDFNVGIFGLLGTEADSNVPQAKPLTFWHEDPTDTAHGFDQVQAVIDEMKDNGAQMIIHAGHEGINSNGIGEDRDLAAGTTGIDLIMSGHRHQVLNTPDHSIKVGKTYIVGVGEYGEFVGQVDIAFNLTQEEIMDATTNVHPIDDTVMGDATVQAIMDQYIAGLDSALASWGLPFTYSATPIAHTTFDLWMFKFYTHVPTADEIETPIGLIIADAQRAAINSIINDASMIPNYDASPVTMAIIETGAVRDPILAGKTGYIAAADAFRGFPLGIGPDGTPGYPMLTFYIHPSELKIILNMNVEVLKGNVPFEYYLNPAGVRYLWDDSRAQFDKVTHAYACALNDPFSTTRCFIPTELGGYGTEIDLNDSTSLIRVAVDYYVALLLPEARNALGENLVIDPKFKDGTPVDMTNPIQVASLRFDADPTTEEVDELKAWLSFIMFLASLPDTWEGEFNGGEPADGVPSVPARIYDRSQTPTDTDPYWQVGLNRNMEIQDFCAVPAYSSLPACSGK